MQIIYRNEFNTYFDSSFKKAQSMGELFNGFVYLFNEDYEFSSFLGREKGDEEVVRYRSEEI